MFERFTERARQVVVLAGEEARTLKHGHIGSEHILLGLLREHDGIAARVLGSFDITVERVRGEVVRIVGVGEEPTAGQIPFTPQAKQILELALQQALSIGHNYIGTEHILLGLLALEDGPTAEIFRDLQIAPEVLRSETMRSLAAGSPAPGGQLRHALPVPGAVQDWFHVGPDPRARRLLMLAAARALDEGRSEIEPRDILLALTRDQNTAPLLAELGVDEAALRGAIERRRPPEAPPRASAEG